MTADVPATGRDDEATVHRLPCPTCTGPTRKTVGMVCQTCGTDYAAPPPVADNTGEELSDWERERRAAVPFMPDPRPAVSPGGQGHDPNARDTGPA